MAGLHGVFDLQAMGEGRFAGAPTGEGGTHVYGGHSFAQALLAGLCTLGPDWACYAANAQFLRVGTPADAIEYVVEPTAISRAFATQRIVASQKGRPIMVMTASFQKPGAGPDFQADAALCAPPPDAFEPEGERFRRMVAALPSAGEGIQLLPSGIDARWTDPQDLEAPVVKSASRRIWLRATEAVGDDPQSRQVALAYCSDYSFVETALRPLGVSWFHPPEMIATSLQHGVWFHRPTDIAAWHLCSSVCPTAQSGRAFIRGELHDRDGRLVASLVQEGAVRLG